MTSKTKKKTKKIEINIMGDKFKVDEEVNKTLKALSDSYEDVNYHSENQDLGNAIEYIEDAKGIEDLERAQDFLEMHKKKAAKTLKDITRR